MRSFASDETVVVRLDPGDPVLASIETAVADHDLHTAVVVSGIGTFRGLHIHYLHTTDLDDEPRNTYLDLDGAWEINAIQGVVADGEPHLHVTAFDGDRTVAGHLEPGNEINALGEIVLQRVDDLALTRRPNAHDVPMLEEA
jgi:predicted DNA-binding protein with PD1-like motif